VLGRLSGLDTLRAVAVLAVMLYHLTIFGELPMRILPFTYFGWMGVDLFFVLSGFLIGHQLFRGYLNEGRPSIAQFYRRRAWRILPAYFAVLELYFFVPAWREAPAMAPAWKFFTFTMNFGFSFDARAFSHAWSLCIEEHFYLFLPLITALFMKRPSTARTVGTVGLITAAGIGLRWWLLAQSGENIWPRLYYPTYTRLDGLLAGITLALVVVFRPKWWEMWRQRGHLLLASGAVCVGAVIWMLRERNLGDDTGSARWALIVGFPLISWGLALITASAMSANGWLARVRVPGAKGMASLAFALYLTHKAVGHLVMTRLPGIAAVQGPVSWLLYAVGCLGAAMALHFSVERPFLALRDRGERSAREMEAAMRVDPAL